MFIESFVKGLGKATAAAIVVGSVLSIVLREPSKTKKARVIPNETQTQTEEENFLPTDDLEMDSIDTTTVNNTLPSSISFKQLFDHKFV